MAFVCEAIVCPHCREAFQVVLDVTVSARLSLAETADEKYAEWLGALTDNERGVLQRAKDAGMLAAYIEARLVTGERVGDPLHAERGLLTFLRRAERKEIATVVIAALRAGGYVNGVSVSALVWCGVVAVVVDGRLSAFFPQGHVLGVFGKNRPAHTRKGADLDALAEWVRTKHGYVPRGSIMEHELRAKHIGDFAALSVGK